MGDLDMFVKLNVLVNNQEREVFLITTKIFGVSKSETLGLTCVLSDTGHALVVKESLEEVKNMIAEARKNIDKV